MKIKTMGSEAKETGSEKSSTFTRIFVETA